MCLLGKAGGTRPGPQPRGAHMHTAPGGSQRAHGVDTLGGVRPMSGRSSRADPVGLSRHTTEAVIRGQ